jgi:hypothetical protein
MYIDTTIRKNLFYPSLFTEKIDIIMLVRAKTEKKIDYYLHVHQSKHFVVLFRNFRSRVGRAIKICETRMTLNTVKQTCVKSPELSFLSWLTEPEMNKIFIVPFQFTPLIFTIYYNIIICLIILYANSNIEQK